MFPAGIITFRETFEIVLVIGIVLTFLSKLQQPIYKKFVWWGVATGILISIALAYFINVFFGGLTGRPEKIFEGVLMFITAVFLTWMIMWIHKQKDVARKIKEKVSMHVEKGYGIGIFILLATSVFREGTETVLYLKASSIAGATNQLNGAIMGIVAALFFGYLLFRWAMRVNISTVFNITGVFLIMFAAGLVSHGVHEFQEIAILPVFSSDPLFTISHMLDQNSVVGSFLRTLFGYTDKPTFLELASYAFYVVFILWLQKTTDLMLHISGSRS